MERISGTRYGFYDYVPHVSIAASYKWKNFDWCQSSVGLDMNILVNSIYGADVSRSL